MRYPVKFLLPADNYKKVSIHSPNFPPDVDKDLIYCPKLQCFTKIIYLTEGVYTYQFNADGNIISDTLRTALDGEAVLEIGGLHNDGVIFNVDKFFVKNSHLVLTLGFDITMWQTADLNIQTLTGVQVIKGKSIFLEGSYDYLMFVIDISDEEMLYAFFELQGFVDNKFYGENGLKNAAWSVNPFEIREHKLSPITQSDVVGIYHLANPKSVVDFEKYISYFDKFPIDYISGDIPEDSLLYKSFQHFSYFHHPALTCLLRNIFVDIEDVNPSLGLLGRFAYEHKQDISMISIVLSDENISFWEMCKRRFSLFSCAVGFQLLGMMTPQILFGEEIGLAKTGSSRQMYWTRAKWNKNIYHFYQKLLKLRKKYPVLRKGRFRFVMQDCSMWGIERYMTGEDSIYVFVNLSEDNVIIDLTKIMDYSGPILELLSEHPLKRKKVCTIFGESIVAFKANGIKNQNKVIKEDEVECFLEIEDDLV